MGIQPNQPLLQGVELLVVAIGTTDNQKPPQSAVGLVRAVDMAVVVVPEQPLRRIRIDLILIPVGLTLADAQQDIIRHAKVITVVTMQVQVD